MMPSSLFEFRSVALYPSPNGGVIHPQVSLLEKLLDLAIGKRVSQVPSDGTENDFGSKVAPLKDRTFGHDRRMVERAKRSCNTSKFPLFQNHSVDNGEPVGPGSRLRS